MLTMRRLGIHYCRLQFLLVVVVQFVVVFPVTEKEILLEFKDGISSDPYKRLSSWVPNGNPCQNFSGVSCNSDGNVARIVLWNTSLGGVLSPALSGLKSLRSITLFGNRFTGNIPKEYGEMDTLWKINLSSNALSGSIPEFLGNLSNLRFLDLSRNGYSGDIPPALFNNCLNAKFISLAHNYLSGPIPSSIQKCVNLLGVDLSFNRLNGGLPSQVCDIPGLNYLSLRSNVMTGSVTDQISECRSLELLDLGSNMFTGLAPFLVVELKAITYFNISDNGFQGDMPEIENCGERLERFDASRNDFYGKIPLGITKCRSLRYLNLGSNKLNGSIPAEFGTLEWLQALDLHNLNLSGKIPEEISKCRFLIELDVSRNSLQGGIPVTLDNASFLLILDLSHNQLNGSIPFTLGNLSNIKFLDLSQNLLSGPIPLSLGNLKNLTHFNVSYNNLSGVIPSIPAIQNFGLTAFFHNSGLCGVPLETPCSANGTNLKSGKPKLLSVTAIVAIIAAAVILIGVCIITIINMRARRRRKEERSVVESTPLGSTDSNVVIGKLVLFSKSLPSKYEDWEAGTKALLDKECLVGGGSIGTVYRTSFEGGVSIAVKKLETLGRIRSQDEFENEIGRLGNLQHPNLVAFQGFYWSSSMQLLLSEFVLNGNLYDNLHGFSHPSTSTGVIYSELNWPRRFKIALGTARALAYLHHDCKPPVLHLNIKSRNILLDENYEAKLSDYGLAKLLHLLDNYGFTKFHNAVGYVAPELAQSMRLSDKCDVYSFGVILLELVTGRKPVESPAGNEVVILCEYVRDLIDRGTASDCFDRTLRGFVESELIQVMKLGLICTSESSSRRPSMAEAVQVLESIRNGLEL